MTATYPPLTIGRGPAAVTFTVTARPAPGAGLTVARPTVVALTVARPTEAGLTVARPQEAGFTVRGYGGALIPVTVDFALLTETGAYLTTEAGDILLTA